MNESKNLVIVGVVVGLLLGYIVETTMNTASKTHVMPDGTVMNNDISGDMSHMMDDMMAGIQGKTGDDFDKAFLKEMIVHHQGAVLMAELALKNAKHQEIKDLSKNIISAQNKEIGEMNTWYSNWYK